MRHNIPCRRCGATTWYNNLHVCYQCPWCEEEVKEGQKSEKDSHGRSWHSRCVKECGSNSNEPRGE